MLDIRITWGLSKEDSVLGTIQEMGNLMRYVLENLSYYLSIDSWQARLMDQSSETSGSDNVSASFTQNCMQFPNKRKWSTVFSFTFLP